MAVIEHRLLRDLEERFRKLPPETPLAKVIDELFNEDEQNQLFEEQDAIYLTRPTPIVTGRLLVLERLIKEALAAGVLTATDAANDQRSR